MKNYRWAHTTKASQKENIDCQMKIKEMSHEIEIEMNGEEEVDIKKKRVILWDNRNKRKSFTTV
jgi:hypothetical protein